MRVLALLTLGVAICAIGALLWVRLSALPAKVWHVDPVGAPPLSRPNGFRMTDGGDVPATVAPYATQALAAAFLEVALAAPRTRLLAGDAESGWFTLLQRSNLMGYPDVISVRVVPTADGSALHVLSRSRFGYFDLGVNSARVRDWSQRALQKLEAT